MSAVVEDRLAMRDKQQETRGLAEIVAAVISPILIMLLVGSLVYFLIEVLYGGDYAGRMRWTFGFYVFGAVLVARLAIEEGNVKATAYAGALGVVAFLAMLRFVEFPRDGWLEHFGWVINIGLLGLVWWCARRLTWDCTHVDDKQDASDRSLLEATGLDALERPEEWREPPPAAGEPIDEKLDFWQRVQAWRKKQRDKPHTPGTWVVYFSLAALPIFGLGQALIPTEHKDSRQFSFWLMAVYIGSGLSLLMTTSFLGLRRYLQQRRLKLPMSMASLWLGIGAALIAVFLLVSAVLPRPSSETPLVEFTPVGSKDRDSSRYAQQDDSPGKGDGSGSDQSDEKSQSQNSAQGKSEEAGKGKGKDDARKGAGDNKGKGGNTGRSDQSGNQSQGGNKEGDAKSKKDRDSDSKNKNDDQGQADDRQQGSGPNDKRKSSEGGSKQRSSSRGSSSKGPVEIGALGKFGSILKWIVFAILVLVVGFFLLRHGLKFLANFTTWAKQLLDWINSFWAWMFGGKRDKPMPKHVPEPEGEQPSSLPFSAYSNPFESGAADREPPEKLVRYSFAALEAFAAEHDLARSQDETPLEFGQRLARRTEELAEDAPRLASLYARLAYARGRLPSTCRQNLESFWRQLEQAHFDLQQAEAAEP